MKKSRAFVYILRCADGSLYTGYTTDLQRRVKQHSSGNGGRYTRTRTPVVLVYSHECRSRSEAMQLEVRIKQLPRQRKLALITLEEQASKSKTSSRPKGALMP